MVPECLWLKCLYERHYFLLVGVELYSLWRWYTRGRFGWNQP